MTEWRKGEPKIWRWRIRARSSDGQMVTLGKYGTEAEARADHDRIIKDKSYRNVSLEPLTTA
ncbi:MAG: hypothetical protein HY718_20390 [Planctomycetes bacterium]|nr:hypothetical protein [Planctomycetota bacterium]